MKAISAAQILADEKERRRNNLLESDRLLSTIRAARIIGVSAVTLSRMSRDGLIDRVRIGSAYLYRPADVRAYLERAS